jgi:NAD(P)-dependent dehydrogenase (short-subunit alcohol dehydrogenase family)
MAQAPRRWLVSGVSSGIGRSLAELIASRGETVIGTVRNEDDRARFAALSPTAIPLLIDLTDPAEQVESAVRGAIETAGGLDILVNNAGYGLIGAIEESTEDESRHQMETNFWGAWKLVRASLPALRQSDCARIINISSMAGFEGVPGMGIYNASKFALSGLSHALRIELADVGVKVTVVEPGGFRTEWAGAGIKTSANTMAEYASTTKRIRAGVPAMNGRQHGDPQRAAAALVALAEHPDPPLRLPLGTDAVKALRANLARTAKSVDTWQELSESTDFPREPSV